MNKKKKKKENTKENFWIKTRINQFKEFFDQSKIEMKKVTYPSRKQTLTTCGSVLFLVVLIAVFLGIVDVALAKIIEVILP
jgi:preprotein translocase subunit SecE